MKQVKKLTMAIALLACVSLFSGVASATHLSCASQVGSLVVTEVNSLASGVASDFSCNAGGLQFDQFYLNAPNPTAGVDQGIRLQAVIIQGSAVNLLFQLVPGLANNTGITFFYRVQGYQVGYDVELGGNPVSRIIEDVCSGAFTGIAGSCVAPNTLLSSFTANANTISGLIRFTVPVTTAYFKKDLSVSGQGAFSDFVNSHHTPEPGTYAMMGAGLLGLAFLKRKRSKG